MNDKSMLIVGGSGGIGAALAMKATQAGWNLTIHGRDIQKLKHTLDACTALCTAGQNVSALQLELDTHVVPDLLVNAAKSCDAIVVAYGPFLMESLEETRPEDWAAMAWANLALPGMLASAAARAMASRDGGRILLFGGTRTETVRGFKKNAAYAASKTGLGVVVKSVAAEYASRGVSAALLCPGMVRTEYQDPAFRQRMDALSPRGSQSEPAAIASVALWLLSGGMDTCNGAIINADEGLYAL